MIANSFCATYHYYWLNSHEIVFLKGSEAGHTEPNKQKLQQECDIPALGTPSGVPKNHHPPSAPGGSDSPPQQSNPNQIGASMMGWPRIALSAMPAPGRDNTGKNRHTQEGAAPTPPFPFLIRKMLWTRKRPWWGAGWEARPVSLFKPDHPAVKG